MAHLSKLCNFTHMAVLHNYVIKAVTIVLYQEQKAILMELFGIITENFKIIYLLL